MKYKDFDSFKINENNIMDIHTLSSYEIKKDVECEYNIFVMFPKYSFVIITNNGSCYVYSKNNKREKYLNVEDLEKRKKINFKNSIIHTKIGQQIKNQYENKSGIKIADILQIKIS